MRILAVSFSLIFLFACNNSVDRNDKNIKIEKNEQKNKNNKPVKYTPLIKKLSTDTFGLKIEYYKTGQKKSQGILIDGKREGRWTYWFPNGNIWSEGEFKNGQSEGMFTIYKSNGEKFVESFYKNGKKYKDIYYKDNKIYREITVNIKE